MKAVTALCDCQLDSFELLTLFNKVFIAWTCVHVELLFLVLCSLAPRNLKWSLNVFWRQVLGLSLEAQVLVNNTADTWTNRLSWAAHRQPTALPFVPDRALTYRRPAMKSSSADWPPVTSPMTLYQASSTMTSHVLLLRCVDRLAALWASHTNRTHGS